MSNTVIVVVTDLDNSAHGEINVVGSMEEAAQLVETLIESGYDQERVSAFAGDEFQISVYHRPVVAFATPAEAGEAEQPDVSVCEDADQKEDASLVGAAAAASLLTAEAAPEPYVQNGVRFSSQFSPA